MRRSSQPVTLRVISVNGSSGGYSNDRRPNSRSMFADSSSLTAREGHHARVPPVVALHGAGRRADRGGTSGIPLEPDARDMARARVAPVSATAHLWFAASALQPLFGPFAQGHHSSALWMFGPAAADPRWGRRPRRWPSAWLIVARSARSLRVARGPTPVGRGASHECPGPA